MKGHVRAEPDDAKGVAPEDPEGDAWTDEPSPQEALPKEPVPLEPLEPDDVRHSPCQAQHSLVPARVILPLTVWWLARRPGARS